MALRKQDLLKYFKLNEPSIRGAGVIGDTIKYSQKGAETIFPSTKPVFNRYWSGDVAKGAFNTKTGVFSKQFWKPEHDPRDVDRSKMMKSPDPRCERNVPEKKKGKVVGYYGFECNDTPTKPAPNLSDSQRLSPKTKCR